MFSLYRHHTRNRMNIQHLRYFEVIAYYQNLSKAAQVLRVSQPALSNVLSQLETELGVPLFERTGKKLLLNSSGKLFLRTTKNILHLLDDSISNLKNQQTLTGQLRICFHIYCAELLNDISAFAQLNPDVQFYFYSADKLKGNLLATMVDMVVLPDYKWESVPTITLEVSNTIYAVLPRGHRFAERDTLELSELKDEYFYFTSSRDGVMGRAYNRCLDAGFTPKVRYVSDDNIAYQSILLTGTAITLTYDINSLFYQQWNDDLVAVPIREKDHSERKVGLCFTSSSPSPLLYAFWNFVLERHGGAAACEGPPLKI